jgi:hypothetical protein
MPFFLQKVKGNKYFVVDTSGKRYSKKPLSKTRAEKQLTALHIHTGHGLYDGSTGNYLKGGLTTSLFGQITFDTSKKIYDDRKSPETWVEHIKSMYNKALKYLDPIQKKRLPEIQALINQLIHQTERSVAEGFKEFGKQETFDALKAVLELDEADQREEALKAEAEALAQASSARRHARQKEEEIEDYVEPEQEQEQEQEQEPERTSQAPQQSRYGQGKRGGMYGHSSPSTTLPNLRVPTPQVINPLRQNIVEYNADGVPHSERYLHNRNLGLIRTPNPLHVSYQPLPLPSAPAPAPAPAPAQIVNPLHQVNQPRVPVVPDNGIAGVVEVGCNALGSCFGTGKNKKKRGGARLVFNPSTKKYLIVDGETIIASYRTKTEALQHLNRDMLDQIAVRNPVPEPEDDNLEEGAEITSGADNQYRIQLKHILSILAPGGSINSLNLEHQLPQLLKPTNSSRAFVLRLFPELENLAVKSNLELYDLPPFMLPLMKKINYYMTTPIEKQNTYIDFISGNGKYNSSEPDQHILIGDYLNGSGYYQDELNRRLSRFPEHIANPIIERTLPLLKEVGPSKGLFTNDPEKQQRKQNIIDEAIAEAESQVRQRETRPIFKSDEDLESVYDFEPIEQGTRLVDYNNNDYRHGRYISEPFWNEMTRQGRTQHPETREEINPRNVETYVANILPRKLRYNKYRQGEDVWYTRTDARYNPVGETTWKKPEPVPGQQLRRRNTIVVSSGQGKLKFVKKYLKGQGIRATKKNIDKICNIMDVEGVVFE